MPEEGKTAPEILEELYRDMDAKVAVRAAEMKVTCKKGCWACCTLLAVINIADGVYIADHLLKQPNWEEWLPKLRDYALEFCVPKINKDMWWKKQKPCVFLAEDKTCQVYEKRPAACRYHMVVSPPENCYMGAENTQTRILDLVQAEHLTSWGLSEEMSKVHYTAPIPLMVLHCMELIAEDEEVRKKVHEFSSLVPEPEQWLKSYAMDFLMSDEILEAAMRLKGRIGPEKSFTTPMFRKEET